MTGTRPRCRKTGTRAIGVLALLWILQSPPELAARECSQLAREDLRTGHTIQLVTDARLPLDVVERAIALWSSCPNYATGFPRFVVNKEGTQNLIIEYEPGKIGWNHCGSFRGSKIQLFDFTRNAGGAIVSCGALDQNLAHELGHVLGLAHAPAAPQCRNHIMSLIERANARGRSVQPDECRAIEARWWTTASRRPPGLPENAVWVPMVDSDTYAQRFLGRVSSQSLQGRLGPAPSHREALASTEQDVVVPVRGRP